MKLQTILFSSLLVAGSAIAHESKEKSVPVAPVMTTADGKVYGVRWPSDAEAPMSITDAAGKLESLEGKPQAYSGRITQVCQEMGCWMVLSGDDGKFARVTMHGHSFGIPKESTGEALVYGTLTEKDVTKKEADHLVADGAKAPASRELQIDATSVLIHNES